MFIALAYLVCWFGYVTRHILVPLFVGLLFAYLCHPIIAYAQRRWHVRRPISAGLLLLMALALFTGLGIWLIPLLVDQITELIAQAPNYLRRLGFEAGLDMEALAERTRQWVVASEQRPMQIVDAVGGVLGATSRVLLWIFLPPMSFFFFSWWMPGMYSSAMRYVPARRRERVEYVLGRMNDAVGGFMRSRIIVSIIIGIMFSGGFYLAGVPYWILLGMSTGLLSAIPYLSVLGWLIAVMVKYFDMSMGGEVSWTAVLVWPSVVYWGVNLIEEWVLLPWIQSREMDLSALTLLVVALLGGVVGGILGLFLAVPVAACVKIIMEEVVLPEVRRWARTH